MAYPRLLQRLRSLQILVVTHEGLLGQVVPPLLHAKHRAPLPLLSLLLLLLDLGLQFLLIGDRGRNLLLGLRQLTAHIRDQLVQHLLRIFCPADQIVDVRLEQRTQAIKDPHNPLLLKSR